MNVVSMKLKIDNKKVATYHFATIKEAADFQQVFIDKNQDRATFEVFYEDLPKTGSLLRELSLNANKRGETEYHKNFI